MPEVTVDAKTISIKDLAMLMEEIKKDEDKNLKELENLPEDIRQGVELLVGDILQTMSKDMSWLPMAVTFDPENRSYLDINFKIIFNDAVKRVSTEKEEIILNVAETRADVRELLDDTPEK